MKHTEELEKQLSQAGKDALAHVRSLHLLGDQFVIAEILNKDEDRFLFEMDQQRQYEETMEQSQ
mgnify:CR=1 FL=1